MGHITHKEDFRRAFAAATLHDFFNILSVILIFPLQYFFNILGISAHFLATLFANVGGLKISNPLGKLLEPVSKFILSLFPRYPWIGVIVAFVLLFFALTYLVKLIKSMVLGRIEVLFDQYIFKNTLRAFLFGLFLTATVQSSSITTSLMIPLAAAGVLSLKKIYPYDLGANIGTTITAFLASLATNNINAITIAFSHTLFNVMGTCVFLPLQRIPIGLAKLLASLTAKSRLYAIGYVLLVFFILPLIFIFITR